MNKTVKILLKVIAIIISALILLFISIIIYSTITNYQPPLRQKLNLYKKACFSAPDSNIISVLSWNIGYCGLGKEADFFYDGGKMSRPPKELFQKYLNGVMNFLTSNDTVDVMFLQEVDSNARRSYYSDQTKLIDKFLPMYQFCFAKNYDVKFVPTPFTNPMGKVVAGMMTLSKIAVNESWRYAYPSNFSWPKSVFLLDRCLIMSRIKLKNGKSLVLINTHNSAYDEAVEIREMEADVIKSLLIDEYSHGNYVIAGGDWNRNPPGFDMNKIISSEAHRLCGPSVSGNFLPRGWNWVFQKNIPTNRDVNSLYVKGKTKTTIIDYFVLSPNIKLLESKTIPTGFAFSDHQPVFIRVELITDTAKASD